LKKLLPKSILHPPRHSITLPFPTSGLKVLNGDAPSTIQPNATSTSSASVHLKAQPSKPEQANLLPIPDVHYAPSHIKGITTTTPVDGIARKQKRLEEVRKRRVGGKERKKNEREEERRRWEKGLGKRG